MNTESQTAMGLMMTYISNNQSDKLTEVISIVPIDAMSRSATDKLLRILLTQCVNYRAESCAQILIEQWKLRVSGETVRLPGVEARIGNVIALEHIMFLEALYWGDEILEFLVEVLDITFFELMLDLIEYKYSEDTNIACETAFRLISHKYKILTELIEIMDGYSSPYDYNNQVYQCLSIKVMELAPLAEKPDWLTPPEADRESLPTVSQLEVEAKAIETAGRDKINQQLEKQPDLRKVVDWMTESTKSQLIEIQEADGEDAVREIVKQQIDELSEAQLETLIREIVEIQTADSLYTNGRLAQIYGPDNSGVAAEPEESVASKYRMFPCDIFDYDEDINDFGDPGELFDWFDPYELGHGNCQNCLLRIAYRWWAVRIPTEKGGWKGCYCSWDCTQRAAKELYDADRLFIVILKILVIARNIKALGIQDRQPDPEPEPEKEPEPAGFGIFEAFNL